MYLRHRERPSQACFTFFGNLLHLIKQCEHGVSPDCVCSCWIAAKKKQRNLRYRFWMLLVGFSNGAPGGEGKCYQIFPSQVAYLVVPGSTNGYTAHCRCSCVTKDVEKRGVCKDCWTLQLRYQSRERALGSCYRCQRKFNKHLCQVLKWGYL